MNKQFARYLQMTLITMDLLLLNTAFILSPFFLQEGIPPTYFQSYIMYLAISNGLWLILSFFLRAYTGKNILIFENFTKRSLQVYFIWIIVILFYLFFTRQLELSRLFLIVSIAGFGVGLMFNRFLYLSIRSYNKSRENFVNKVLALGYNEIGQKLTKYFEDEGLKTQILGYVEDEKEISHLTPYPVYRGMENTVKLALDLGAMEIYSTISPEQDNRIYGIMSKAEIECIRFKILPNLAFFIKRNVHIDYFNDLPIISLRSEALDDVGNKIKSVHSILW